VLLTAASLIFLVLAVSGVRPWRQARIDASESRFAAARLMLRQGWFAEAATGFNDVVRREPDNGHAWLNLAMALNARGELDRAIEVSERAAQYPEVRAASLFESARARARAGRLEEALAALAAARDAGYYAEPDAVVSDPQFASLRPDGRLRELAATMVPPQQRFDQLCLERDHVGLVALWKTYPQQAVALLRDSIERSLGAGSGGGGDDEAGPYLDRAMAAAAAATDAFGRPEFADFARTASAWDAADLAERGALKDALRRELASLDAQDARRIVRRARALGDPYLLITALLRTSLALEELGTVHALVEALNGYREAAGLARKFGSLADEAEALRGQARVLEKLGRPGEAARLWRKLREFLSLLPAGPPTPAPHDPPAGPPAGAPGGGRSSGSASPAY